MATARWWALPLVAAVALSACASLPTGPSVMVLPAAGKPFEVFQTEELSCRQWAAQLLGIAPAAAANQSALGSAVVGTLVGAGLGAAIGAAVGNPGIGAAIGAGVGLLGGTAVGADAAALSGWEAQRRYDIAYQQCMYAKGNQIPGIVRRSQYGYRPPPPPPPPSYNVPPPPASAPGPGATAPPPATPPPANPPRQP